MEDFGEVQVFTGAELAEKKHETQAVVAVEQSRAVAEAQAAMAVARACPRDEQTAYLKIMKACRRKSLAEQAEYAYKRGSSVISGPSIKLAEVCAQGWGNITYGIKELGRSGGASEVEAFAWDMENNVRVSRTFQVKHIREKKQGNEALTGERDIYELVANMGQRRVRAAIFEVIPGDIVEAAREQCKKTLESGDGKPLADRVRDMLVAFEPLGVTREMIESHVGHPTGAIVQGELTRLTQIYRSLKDGVAQREDFFSLSTQTQPEQPEAAKRGRPRKEPEAVHKQEPADPATETAHSPGDATEAEMENRARVNSALAGLPGEKINEILAVSCANKAFPVTDKERSAVIDAANAAKEGQ